MVLRLITDLLAAPLASLLFAITGQLADALITVFGIRYFGMRERNPLMRPFVNSYAVALLAKSVGLAIFCFMAYRTRSRSPLNLAGLGGWIATIWNMSQLLGGFFGRY